MGDRISLFLAELREYVPDALDRFRCGSCFGVFRLIKAFCPEAEAWYSPEEGHVFTKVGGKFYEIGGRVVRPPKDTLPINQCKPRLAVDACGWRYD